MRHIRFKLCVLNDQFETRYRQEWICKSLLAIAVQWPSIKLIVPLIKNNWRFNLYVLKKHCNIPNLEKPRKADFSTLCHIDFSSLETMFVSLGDWIHLGLDFDWNQIQIVFVNFYPNPNCLLNPNCLDKISYIISRFNRKVWKRSIMIKGKIKTRIVMWPP